MVEVRNTEVIELPKKVVKSTRAPKQYQSVSPVETIKKNIIAAVTRDGGRYINADGQTYILVAACVEDGDPGFVVLDANKDLMYLHYSTRYKLAKEIPANFSIVDYLYTHASKDLYDLVDERLNAFNDILVKNSIKVSHPRKDNKKFGNKNNKSKKFNKTNKK